ncbi:MAG: glycine cleavage system aminomethyltransferase GcvT [Silvanigrellales bacterium]|nr:glycine cleavage system aminomethyltransferase GcvT [Silvanigrellales bacterium]
MTVDTPDFSVALKRTPLHADHVRLKARMVDFGGWDMPVQYSGLVDEHKTVRTAVGLFDVSHMGEVNVEGRGALEFLQRLTTNDASKLEIGQAQYSALLYPNGTLVDDIIVYRRGLDSFFLCVNASNAEKDFAWMQEHVPSQGVVLQNVSESYGQIAVQGPRARELVQKVVDIRIAELKYYHFAEGKVLGVPALIARTGYTGELGYELYVPSSATSKVWNALLEAGDAFGVKPCGLGARDTLRLEMGYLLYGNDMDNTTSALECGLSWVTKFEKCDFIGRDALLKQKEQGLGRKLVGFEMIDRAIGRHGYGVHVTPAVGSPVGVVTSGSPSPTLGRNVGMAYVPASHAALGSEIYIDVRGEAKKARVTKKPFFTEGTASK